MFISVDLPDPELPMIATISPGQMSMSTSRRTVIVSSPA
ncbi:hypothetical protein PAYE108092_11800 [Paracoccus yeei]